VAFSAFFMLLGLTLYMHAFNLGLSLFVLGFLATFINAGF